MRFRVSNIKSVIAAVAVFAFAGPVMAEPLGAAADGAAGLKTGSGGIGQADSALPRIAVRKSSGAASLADANRNGLSDSLETKLAGLTPGSMVDVIVSFSGPGNAASARSAVGGFAVRHEFRMINAFAATVTAAQARALASVSGVFRVEEDAVGKAMMEAARRDFGVKKLRDEAAALGVPGVTGAGVGICVADSGAFNNHEQFVDEGTGVHKIAGFQDFIGGANGVKHTTSYDDLFHGTHVAGIAAGDGTGPSAWAGRLGGVAPGASLYIAKVLDHAGSGSESIIMQGLEWCAAQTGVRVINLSLGFPGSSDGQSAVEQLVNAISRNGVVVVVAAGNSGAAPSTIGSPGAASDAVTVGAVSEYSASLSDPWVTAGIFPAYFSSRGPTQDGRVKPDITGPGTTIAAAGIENLSLGIVCAQPCYLIVSGTSMASPFVAGVAALMLEANPALTPNDVRRILYKAARDRFPGGGKDNETGFGVVDAHAAVNAARGELITDPLAFPEDSQLSTVVPDNGEILLRIDPVDPALPVTVTVTIDGAVARLGWKPDIDAILLDGNLQPFVITPFLPDVVYPGTLSTCPAGDECGAVGRQETLYVYPSVSPFNRTAFYYVRLYAFDGFPNNGKGGPVKIELSNATAAGTVDTPQSPLSSNAGPDVTVPPNADGFATVYLDGTSSAGSVAAYGWSTDTTGITIPDGMFSSVTLPAGDHVVHLTVIDDLGNVSADSMAVSVSTGGGGKGNGKGGGKPNNNGNGAAGPRASLR